MRRRLSIDRTHARRGAGSIVGRSIVGVAAVDDDTMSSGASAGQLIGALGAFFAAGGVCFYATNVANVFGGATTTMRRRCDDDDGRP
jgi:hypothetical protein